MHVVCSLLNALLKFILCPLQESIISQKQSGHLSLLNLVTYFPLPKDYVLYDLHETHYNEQFNLQI